MNNSQSTLYSNNNTCDDINFLTAYPESRFRVTTIFVAILCYALGPLMFSVLPVVVGAFINHLNLTMQQAGYIAAADIGGLFLGNVLSIWLIRNLGARQIAIPAVGLLFVGNVVSASVQDFQSLMLCRTLTEIGAGVMMGQAMTFLSRTSNADRYFGMSVSMQIFITIILLMIVPRVLEMVGLSGFFIFLAFLCLLSASSWFFPLEIHSKNLTQSVIFPLQDNDKKALRGVFVIMIYWIGIGAFWSYAEILGTSKGLNGKTVANVLAMSQIVGFIGAMTTSWASTRWGRLLPVMIASLVQLGCILFIWHCSGVWAYGVLVGVYSFTWNVILIYQLGNVAEYDEKGVFTPLSLAAQAIGVTIGPALVAFVIQDGQLSPVYWITGVTLMISALLFLNNTRRRPIEAGVLS